jgi:thiol-disulfide isomerase/thioredoxin
MKYLLIALCSLTVAASALLFSLNKEACCEWLGLMAPEGVSEVPGVQHAKVDPARDDGAIPASVRGLKLYDAAGEVSLPDLHNRVHVVDFKSRKFTVFVWVSCVCPTSKAYILRLNELQNEFGKEVVFWAVNSSAMEGASEIAADYESSKEPLNFTVLKDDKNLLADRFGAKVCPDIFVFNREGKLEYRGGVDDSRDPRNVQRRYLHDVLAALLNASAPPWRYQPPNGCCPIDRVEAEPTPKN